MQGKPVTLRPSERFIEFRPDGRACAFSFPGALCFLALRCPAAGENLNSWMGGSNSKPPDRAEMAGKTGVFANRDKGLTAVPEKVFTIENLRTLDLSQNKLIKLPNHINTLLKLKTLSLDKNKLDALPNTLCQLKELQSLSVSNNTLTALPDAIGALGKLKTLVVSHNALNALPESCCALRSLTALDASSNKLSALPAGLGALESLVQADLSNNRIGALPSGLDGLKRIKDLDLRRNAPLVVHGSVPPELLTSTPLHRLEVDAEMLGVDGVISEAAAGSADARTAYLSKRKERIDKEMHSKDRGGEIRFGQ